MKKTLKFLYIIFASIICFCMFSSGVKAVVTCKITEKSENQIKIHIIADEEAYDHNVIITIDSNTHTATSVRVCDNVYRNLSDLGKSSYDCDLSDSANGTWRVNFGTTKLNKKISSFTNSAITCGITPGTTTVNISGISNIPDDVSTAADYVSCSDTNYVFTINKGEANQKECVVTIVQKEKNGDVIMKYGSRSGVKETKTNPKKGKYVCDVDGDSGEFTLEKDLPKGSLNSASDCPKLERGHGFDGTQADIEDPIVKPSDDIIDYPESSTHASDPDDNLKRKGHITVNNIFEVVTNRITCSGALSNTLPILRDIFKYIRLAAALLFLALTSFDYVKAIADSDSSLFKKANQRIVKRAIILVVIIILPSIINLVLAIVQLSNGACEIS